MIGEDNINIGYLKRFVNIFSNLWCRVYPFQSLESNMPRTKRRHQTRSRSRDSYREKRRRLDSEEGSQQTYSSIYEANR
uniref:CSON012302 protein n=1 Tax=Culicoides sonorensis TaxID=179676 RepID=A0A336LJ99_CULSO